MPHETSKTPMTNKNNQQNKTLPQEFYFVVGCYKLIREFKIVGSINQPYNFSFPSGKLP